MSVRVPPLGHLLGPSWGSLGPSWASPAPFWSPFGPSWDPLGGLLGRLETLLGRLGAFLGASWAVLGASWAVLDAVNAKGVYVRKTYVFRMEFDDFCLLGPFWGASWGLLGASGRPLGVSWGPSWASWSHFGRLGAAFERLGSLLGRFWGLPMGPEPPGTQWVPGGGEFWKSGPPQGPETRSPGILYTRVATNLAQSRARSHVEHHIWERLRATLARMTCKNDFGKGIRIRETEDS